jgi:NADPH:quinone reductase-like Zn-dependent oxidoreductase
MRAIVQRAYGSADVLHIEEIDQPTPAPDEVLLQVMAAGLDRGTWHLMAGFPYAVRLATGLRAPKRIVPGIDVAGLVVAVGSKVTRFQAGDEVFGIGKGTFAEFAAAKEEKLAAKPSNLTFEQAAALPVSGITALGAIDAGRLEPAQHVLIIGASGGVGTYAVQIGKALGATVTGVASTGKLDLVRSLGADHVVDYTRADFAAGGHRYDLILDVGGNSSLSRLRRALTKKGTLVIVGGEDGGRWTGLSRQLGAVVLSPVVRQRLTMTMVKEHHDGLDRLAAHVENGSLMPTVERTYELHEAADAMRHLVAGEARGKIVIRVSRS